jgi:phosphoserine aminotransferase
LKLQNVNNYHAPYGELPDLSQYNPDNDMCFTYNGTTSGVRVPNCDWISSTRNGLVLCDATSAVFAMDIEWDKLDVITFSWQKVLGGEGGHGMLILSPRAIHRLETYTPPWPLPKIFRLVNNYGSLNNGIFQGSVINTPSMLCVEDYIKALEWCESLGGVSKLIKQSMDNLQTVKEYVNKRDWISFLAKNQSTISNTSICLTFDLPEYKVKQMSKLLNDYNVAYDINSYRDAPCGFRIWGGATVTNDNIVRLLPWIDWAYSVVSDSYDIKK